MAVNWPILSYARSGMGSNTRPMFRYCGRTACVDGA